ncbi:ABC transporter G family member 23 [Orchesella cincta]|uniref:ABC transporter G family member 23 n=1 Tax=Orchesella cincta TaxID=48709 RepID=A0A1D2MHT4_ORCCI|nr:ABC transporter G family member 23 [Orchesella cincta]
MTETQGNFELGIIQGSEDELDMEIEAAVVVRNAEKCYKVGKPVLSGLDMTVTCGSIYALLGSSGCGKTTLLSCILGIRKLNKGSVWLYGERPGTSGIEIPGRNVGYMPQETSLYNEFTIWETLRYFGTFSGMTEEQVETEAHFFESLLDLPPQMRRIGTLSGGEKRRVSFAAALISNPQLLILDEPTVGVSSKIWSYLIKLVTCRNTTVILSTHHIDEARKANMIGVIRNGLMIAEKSPQELIATYALNGSLETAVLNLCKKDSMVESGTSQSNYKRPKGSTANRRLSTWDREHNARNKLLQKSDDVKMAEIMNSEPEKASFLGGSVARIKALAKKNSVTLLRNPIEYDAKSAVVLGETWGYLVFPQNFSSQMYQSSVLGSNVNLSVLTSRDIIGRLDETNKHISSAIKTTLYKTQSDFISTLLSNCGMDPRRIQSSLRYQKPIFGKDDTDMREYAAPNLSLTAAFFFPIISIGLRFIDEKKCGMMERSLVAGVKTWEIAVGYLISECFVIVTQSALVLAVQTFISEITILGSVWLVFGLFVLVGYCGVSLGFLFGSICNEKMDFAIITMASFFPNVFVSGIFWPVEGMPEFVQKVVFIFPCALPSESLRSIISRGWGISHFNVWSGFVVLAAYIIVDILLTIFVYKL